MSSAEIAYKTIASALVGSADCEWQYIVFQTVVLSKNCSAMQVTVFDINGKSISAGLGMQKAFSVSDGVIYLRDNILAATGQRIWGLTFTLFPDGKFNIEYDYNKPEDYEETDETV